MKSYKIVEKKPLVKLFYKGKHTHPVRRAGLVIDETPTSLTVFELREGRVVRKLKDAPVKTYRKDKIARYGEYCRLGGEKGTTLKRYEVLEALNTGV